MSRAGEGGREGKWEEEASGSHLEERKRKKGGRDQIEDVQRQLTPDANRRNGMRKTGP